MNVDDNIPFCLTNTIDNFVSSGNRYYHNIQKDNNRVKMRPRLPLFFYANDGEFLPLTQDNKKEFISYYNSRNQNKILDSKRLYQWRHTGFTKFNTILMYSLSFVLIVASVGHIKRLVQTMQSDPSLTDNDRMLFRINFILSFFLIVFLLCLMAMSVFELLHNSDLVPTITKNNFQYKNLFWIQDGNMFHMRTIILVFVGCSMLLVLAEIINLFIMRRDKTNLLVLFVPVFFCIVILVYLFMFLLRRRNGNVV